jgi:putative transposase
VQIAPNSYRARKTRQPSDRSCRDEVVTEVIKGLHRQNYGVYGTRKIYEALRREGGVEGRHVARCTVERLMRGAGLRGMLRAKTPRTTRPAPRDSDTRPDLVDRCFAATAPNRLWVADITYVRTFSGWVYAAFVLDVFSRRIVGWQLSNNLRTDLALDALNMGLWLRRGEGADLRQLIHHSDRGVQYVAVRYTERLAEVEVVASVGSVGDSYDNAMAEARGGRIYRLVQPPAPARRARPGPTRRVRTAPQPRKRHAPSPWSVRTSPPRNPGLDRVWSMSQVVASAAQPGDRQVWSRAWTQARRAALG